MDDGARRWGIADDGTTVEIDLSPALEGVLARNWPPIGLRWTERSEGTIVRHVTVAAPAPDAYPTVRVDGAAWLGGWDRVESELALFAAERLATRVAVHAAVIRRGDAALLVPGPSHAGKSTLCVAARDEGADVLSDEYALVEPASGLVTGWPRPMRIRHPDGRLERVDVAVASDPVTVGLVALVHHEAGSNSSWQPISTTDTVLRLLANTVCAQSRPDDALDAASAIARTAPAVAGPRGEASDAVRELLSIMASLP